MASAATAATEPSSIVMPSSARHAAGADNAASVARVALLRRIEHAILPLAVVRPEVALLPKGIGRPCH